MSRSEVEEFVAKLFAIKAREETAVLSQREAELLVKINQGLPASTQQRLADLIRKRQTETISPEELQELLQLTEQIELADAERLRHLIELSHLRNVPLQKLLRQLGLSPAPP